VGREHDRTTLRSGMRLWQPLECGSLLPLWGGRRAGVRLSSPPFPAHPKAEASFRTPKRRQRPHRCVADSIAKRYPESCGRDVSDSCCSSSLPAPARNRPAPATATATARPRRSSSMRQSAPSSKPRPHAPPPISTATARSRPPSCCASASPSSTRPPAVRSNRARPGRRSTPCPAARARRSASRCSTGASTSSAA
jgi:hypothetical protein